jgi:MOSC domain-containing protein YiiM
VLVIAASRLRKSPSPRTVQRFDGTMALNARVVTGGQIHVGDTVELLE